MGQENRSTLDRRACCVDGNHTGVGRPVSVPGDL